MRNILFYIFSFSLLTAACQKLEPDSDRLAAVSFYLENAPLEGETVTRTVMPAVDINKFVVKAVSGKDVVEGNYNRHRYLYEEIVANKNIITLEEGVYTVSAENVSETEALSMPTAWGQPHYYAVTEPTPIVAGTDEHPITPVEFKLVCRMVNSAVHVDFDEAFADSFETYRVSIHTMPERRFEYNAYNTTDTYNPVAYFSPGVLHYIFVGSSEGKAYTLKGELELEAATNHFLNFRIDRNPNELGIDIKVDTNYEPVYESVLIKPDFTQN